MVLYQCTNCGYTTKHKETYKRHLNRKNQCISKDSKLVTNVCNNEIPSQNPHKPSQIPIPTMTAYTVGKHLNVKTI